MTTIKNDTLVTAASMVDDIATRRNQPTTEHGQAAIAAGLVAVADALYEVAAAVREGRDA